MPEEAFLRAVIPAVTTLGHRLRHPHFFNPVLKLIGEIQYALITV